MEISGDILRAQLGWMGTRNHGNKDKIKDRKSMSGGGPSLALDMIIVSSSLIVLIINKIF